jgi:hypothetical protein
MAGKGRVRRRQGEGAGAPAEPAGPSVTPTRARPWVREARVVAGRAGVEAEQAALPCASTPWRAQAGGAKPGDRVSALGRRASGFSALAVELGCNVMVVALFARTVATVTLVGLVGDEVRKDLAGPVPATPRKSRIGHRRQRRRRADVVEYCRHDTSANE